MKQKSIKNFNWIIILFAMTIILLPFNNLPYLTKWLKELSYYGSSYPMLILILILFFKIIRQKQIIHIKSKTFYIFIVFIGWGLISFLVNLRFILVSSFKGKTGLGRFLFQYPLIIFALIVSYVIYYIIKSENIKLETIRKYILISSIITGIYSLFEVIQIMHIFDVSFILKNVSKFIQVYSSGQIYDRGVRSVSGEASYFGMYVSFAFPWIFSYVYTEKKTKNRVISLLFSIYLIILIFLSKSRIALLVFFVEIFIFIIGILTLRGNKTKKVWTAAIVVIILFSGILVNKFFYEKNQFENTTKSLSISSLYNSLTDPNNLSNVARYGMQGAAIRMGLHNPVFGVGVGQFAFYVTQYINKDAYKSYEVSSWLDPNLPQLWPTVFSLHSRIVGEVGVLGFIIWASIWIMILYRCIRMYYKNNNIFILIFLTSLIGTLLGAFNLDTFVYYPLWILLGINWCYLEVDTENKRKSDVLETGYDT